MTIDSTPVYRAPTLLWAVLGLGLILAVAMSWDALIQMVRRWETSEEYGYGYMIPVITLFLIWQRKDQLELARFTGSWLGGSILVIGLLVVLVGQLSTLHTITQYGFVIVVISSLYAVMGWAAFRIVAVPLLLLFLMVPLPSFLFNNLSAQLQLISSHLGVAVIRLFDISVHLEGNVIDLGTYQLQVVEACSGLRYLFPLVALSIIASYFYQAATWKRILVILSSIPITIFMNSFRIGVIGVLVDNYGIEQAEGFLHDFEGWIVFMACVALLIVEMWMLSFVGRDRRSFREIFGMDLPTATPAGVPRVRRSLPPHALMMVALLIAGTIGAMAIGGRNEIVPDRRDFTGFPDTLGEWRGRNDSLESVVLDVLKLDDYILANYQRGEEVPVNFYTAYYSSQRSGASAHSPASCLPGGGWRVDSRTQVQLDHNLHANRFVVRMGDQRQLVYYWFKQRDRILTNEFVVKWYLLWDALTRNRTDGALVRLTTPLLPGEDPEVGDARLRDFARMVAAPLSQYVPD